MSLSNFLRACSLSPSQYAFVTVRRARAVMARSVLIACAIWLPTVSHAATELPTAIPPGTKLVVADQNENLQTLMAASGQQARLSSSVSYANFLGGPAILEAFRAGALDLAVVGSAPPIQAQAAGENVRIVGARITSRPEYMFAIRPKLSVTSLQDFKGKRIAYGEGTGRQPFVLAALKQAGLTRKDVTLVPLKAADFPDAVRSGQVDIAALNEPHFTRYLTRYAEDGASGLPDAAHKTLPTSISYLYASAAALANPAKSAAIREFVQHWIGANEWSSHNPQEWVKAYYVDKQRLSQADGLGIVNAEGEKTYPLLKDLIAPQQKLVDLIHAAGDLPRHLDAAEEFDLRFDPAISEAVQQLGAERNKAPS